MPEQTAKSIRLTAAGSAHGVTREEIDAAFTWLTSPYVGRAIWTGDESQRDRDTPLVSARVTRYSRLPGVSARDDASVIMESGKRPRRLSKKQRDELEALMELRDPSLSGPLQASITRLHGFLTSVVSGPLILPSEWIPVVFRNDQSEDWKSLRRDDATYAFQ